jgi:radical SAM protein with 4Fe4S-binding SPASM domain
MVSLAQTARLARKHPRYFAHLLVKKAQFARRYRWVRRHGGSERPVPRPLVYKLMLNWKCNLRCPGCMLWGDVGWVKESREDAPKELPWGVVEKIFASRMPTNASFILSGGEPFQYREMGRLLLELKAHRKFAIICTNGMFLEKFERELDDNPYPTLLVSLDGSENTNDRLRGKGVYRSVLDNIERIQRLRRPPFIGIQFTVMPENVAEMETFCEEMVRRGVDWILLNPGWFIDAKQARDYEGVLQREFGVTPKTHLGYLREYDYDKAEFQRQLSRIWSRRWPIQIASHLKEPEWVQDFIDEPAKLLGTRNCYKQWLRLDVLPDGRVTPCVQFPDLHVGDLKTQSVEEVWHGVENRKFQKFISGGPLPICAKCDNVYLYGARD